MEGEQKSKQNIEEVIEKPEEDINYLQRGLALIGGISIASMFLSAIIDSPEVEMSYSELIDTDGDHLSDEFEIRYGLDPFDSDSDGDGISDFFEAFTFEQFIDINAKFIADNFRDNALVDEIDSSDPSDYNTTVKFALDYIQTGYSEEGVQQLGEDLGLTGETLESFIQRRELSSIVLYDDITELFGDDFDINSNALIKNENIEGYESFENSIINLTDEAFIAINDSLEGLFIQELPSNVPIGPVPKIVTRLELLNETTRLRLAQNYNIDENKWIWAD